MFCTSKRGERYSSHRAEGCDADGWTPCATDSYVTVRDDCADDNSVPPDPVFTEHGGAPTRRDPAALLQDFVLGVEHRDDKNPASVTNTAKTEKDMCDASPTQ